MPKLGHLKRFFYIQSILESHRWNLQASKWYQSKVEKISYPLVTSFSKNESYLCTLCRPQNCQFFVLTWPLLVCENPNLATKLCPKLATWKDVNKISTNWPRELNFGIHPIFGSPNRLETVSNRFEHFWSLQMIFEDAILTKFHQTKRKSWNFLLSLISTLRVDWR